MTDQEKELEKINNRLDSIEDRLSKLEITSSLYGSENSYPSDKKTEKSVSEESSNVLNENNKGIESQIGRFGLAWMGNIVLLVGIIFLVQYISGLGYRYISVFTGYFSALIIYSTAIYIKQSNRYLSFIFTINAWVLLYYITIRLHFVSLDQVLQDKTISIILILLLIITFIYLSIQSKSQTRALLTLVFALVTAVVSDESKIMLPLIILTSILSLIYYYKFRWGPLIILSIILTYFTYFLWLLGNPMMGHTMQLVAQKQMSAIFLFGLGACFPIIFLFRRLEGTSEELFNSVTIVNGLLFTSLLFIVALRFFSTNYVILFTIITGICLLFSIILHTIAALNFASAFYALYGFMAMSIAFYGTFGFPKAYLFLAVQSLVVVSMALWLKNRLIVIMNSLMFIAILIVYLTSSESINSVNFSFALVSFFSARIINWKKSRLQIRTDLIRNLYLVEGFLMMLYALYHAVPRHFVTLSWTVAALVYFLVSLLLKNIKYRYISLASVICAALYLFIVDLSSIDLIYRVLALLFLSAISIGISLYYTNRTKNIN